MQGLRGKLSRYLYERDTEHLTRFEDADCLFFSLDEVTTPLKAPQLWFRLQDDTWGDLWEIS